MDKKPVTYRLDTKLIDRVENYADKHTGNKTKVVEMALREFLDRNEFSATYVMGFDHGKVNDPVYATKIQKLASNKIPVIVFKNRYKENRYLAVSAEAGDFDDKDLDVTGKDIDRAFLIYRKDFSKPDDSDLERVIENSREHKRNMVKRFGKDAVVAFDVDEWFKNYIPVEFLISKEQLKKNQEWD